MDQFQYSAHALGQEPMIRHRIRSKCLALFFARVAPLARNLADLLHLSCPLNCKKKTPYERGVWSQVQTHLKSLPFLTGPFVVH